MTHPRQYNEQMRIRQFAFETEPPTVKENDDDLETDSEIPSPSECAELVD